MAGMYEVRAKGAGHGLFAARGFASGEVVCALDWQEPGPTPGRHTVQIGEALHALPLPAPLRYLNHACAPSVLLDLEAREVRALRAIAAGEELTFFYPSTEWRMTEPFACGCGAAGCLDRVEGAASLSAEILGRYALSPVIRALLEG